VAGKVRVHELAKELGVIVTAHCENETLVAERQKELLQQDLPWVNRCHDLGAHLISPHQW
jgi:dihydroorotase-like cyclic amidohydrolase